MATTTPIFRPPEPADPVVATAELDDHHQTNRMVFVHRYASGALAMNVSSIRGPQFRSTTTLEAAEVKRLAAFLNETMPAATTPEGLAA